MEVTIIKAVAITAESEGELAGKITAFFRAVPVSKEEIVSVHFYDENLEKIMSNSCIIVFSRKEDII